VIDVDPGRPTGGSAADLWDAKVAVVEQEVEVLTAVSMRQTATAILAEAFPALPPSYSNDLRYFSDG